MSFPGVISSVKSKWTTLKECYVISFFRSYKLQPKYDSKPPCLYEDERGKLPDESGDRRRFPDVLKVLGPVPVDPEEVPGVVHEEVDDADVEGDLPDHPPELGHVHGLVGPHLRLVLSQ